MSQSTRRAFMKKSALLAGGLGCASSFGPQSAVALLTAADNDVAPQAIARLRSQLKGTVIVPGDPTYEADKRVFYWNPRTQRKPVAIVRCGHEEDALRGVEFARDHHLEVAVRSGGHSHLAWGSSDGLVIDVSPLKAIQIDPERRVLRAQAGVLGGEAARAAGAFGLAPVFGQCPGVSATGVSLGGGLGWLSGRFGACCDNLLSVRLITADGQLLEVDAQREPELFWALRGAGANFGVAIGFSAQLHAISPVLAGDVNFATRDARAVLRGFSEIMREAPDGFQATLNLTTSERGLFISLCHSGEEREGESLLKKIRLLAKPTRETVMQQPYANLAEKAAATTAGRAAAPAFRAVQTVYRDEITQEVIDIIVDRLAAASPDVILGLSHYMHGEVCRIAPEATAFPHRSEHSVHLRAAFNWNDPADSPSRFAWGEEWLRLMRPEKNERIYANYQTYDTEAGSKSLFADNYARLLTIKNRYDPTNFFRRNANITPPTS